MRLRWDWCLAGIMGVWIWSMLGQHGHRESSTPASASSPRANRLEPVHPLLVPVPRAKQDTRLLPHDWAPTPLNYSVLANARDGSRRFCAQQCAASGRAAYFIKHMRKAGGSSLRDYLAHHVCTGPWLRRHTFINEGAIFDTSLFSSHSFVFVLTLREPIARIVSSYW